MSIYLFADDILFFLNLLKADGMYAIGITLAPSLITRDKQNL